MTEQKEGAPAPEPTARLGRVRAITTSLEAAALAGVLCALLLPLSNVLLLRQPEVGASDAELNAWLADSRNQTSVLIGLNLAPFAAISFLWFVAVIRRRLGEREDQFFGTVFLGSGFALALLTVVSAVAAAAPTLVAHYGHQAPTREIGALAFGFWFGFLVVGATRFAAVFMIVTSSVGLRFHALPRWLCLLGYATALVLFVSGAFSGPLSLLFPVWLLVVSLTLLLRRA